jgi:hypothetical protein
MEQYFLSLAKVAASYYSTYLGLEAQAQLASKLTMTMLGSFSSSLGCQRRSQYGWLAD